MAPAPQTQGEKPATPPVTLWENYTSFSSSEQLALGLLFNPLTRKCLLTPWCSETSAFKYTRQRKHTILFPEYFCWVPKQWTYRLGCSWSSGRCELEPGLWFSVLALCHTDVSYREDVLTRTGSCISHALHQQIPAVHIPAEHLHSH